MSRAWRWTAGLALVFSLAGVVLGGWQAEALGQAWDAMNGLTVLAVAALCWLNYLLRGLRWWLWMRAQGEPLALCRGLRLYLCAYAFTATPGNVGEALRGAWIRPGQPLWSLGIFGAERLADLLALMLLSLAVLPTWLPVLRNGIDSGSALRLLSGGSVLLGLMAVFGGLVWRRRHRVPLWLREAGRCLGQAPALGLGLSVLAWAAQGLAVWLLARDLGLPLDLALSTGYYAAAMIGGAVSALPAGLGSMEALLTAMIVASGAALAPALVLVLLVRVFTLWQAIVAGALILAWSLFVLKDPRLGG